MGVASDLKDLEFELESNRCPECHAANSIKADEHKGETFCEKCGLVTSDLKLEDQRAERVHDKEQRDKRVHDEPTTIMRHDKGLGTKIQVSRTDGQEKRMSLAAKQRMWRLAKWDARTKVSNAYERGLADGLSEVHRISDVASVPQQARRMAAMIYRRAQSKNLIRGRSREGVAGAAIYEACRVSMTGHTPDTIANASRVTRSELMRTHRHLKRKLELKTKPAQPQEYIARFIDTLQLPPDATQKVLREARTICDDMVRKGIANGKSPLGVAATSLYLGARKAGYPITQEQAGDAGNVTGVTIRNIGHEYTGRRFGKRNASIGDANAMMLQKMTEYADGLKLPGTEMRALSLYSMLPDVGYNDTVAMVLVEVAARLEGREVPSEKASSMAKTTPVSYARWRSGIESKLLEVGAISSSNLTRPRVYKPADQGANGNAQST